ncbi:hypothetical protein [Burkholderia ubonensis]|uniref:hypothetical protein n=1 Tax=Burkholderia ubonensis TaxID=101571 RepID=UPI0018DF84E8|nr:hypothetical protein [Burkholderia ubonensis]
MQPTRGTTTRSRCPRCRPICLNSWTRCLRSLWQLNPSTGNGASFLTSLLLDAGLAVGAYDGCVTGTDTGIAQFVAPDSGCNDPTMAAAMAVNPYLRVFSANGYYGSVTPFFQTLITFQEMPLASAQIDSNLTVRSYPPGHMIYLDNESRTAMKADLASFHGGAKCMPRQ